MGNQFRSQQPDTGIKAGLVTVGNADDAYQAYMDFGKKDGRVVDEVPDRVLVRSTPVATGQGYEVVYLRQIVEKVIVKDLYQFSGEDERGQPTPIRLQGKQRGSM
jgi:hypothetical protein